eukprot:TRINITY_DN21129_c0_g1_i1.p1 TRINITY_DN21129_c0_g1~~TRINITY_DN21129_c0_g1_i1.p1  ORF type:complete len:230 (-),score=47.80 TRINITY_DN21129_c0_g1_i1:87-749(-)
MAAWWTGQTEPDRRSPWMSCPLPVSASSPQDAVEVVVPEGCKPKEEFIAVVDNVEFQVSVPEGCTAGSVLRLHMPQPQQQHPGCQRAWARRAEPRRALQGIIETSEVEVTVPQGVEPGDEFVVEVDGIDFAVRTPEGCKPGMQISVAVLAGEDMLESAPEALPSSLQSRIRNAEIPKSSKDRMKRMLFRPAAAGGQSPMASNSYQLGSLLRFAKQRASRV